MIKLDAISLATSPFYHPDTLASKMQEEQFDPNMQSSEIPRPILYEVVTSV